MRISTKEALESLSTLINAVTGEVEIGPKAWKLAKNHLYDYATQYKRAPLVE